MNPLDAEGTYALPLAQMDRFLMKVLVTYPSAAQELAIVERFGGEPPTLPADVVSLDDVAAWRHAARGVYVEPRVARYVIDVVGTTRRPHEYLERGASPRASLALTALARALAYAGGRSFVLPDDVKTLAPSVLRHRIALSYRVVAERVDPEELIAALVASVAIP